MTELRRIWINQMHLVEGITLLNNDLSEYIQVPHFGALICMVGKHGMYELMELGSSGVPLPPGKRNVHFVIAVKKKKKKILQQSSKVRLYLSFHRYD